jgi:expansin
MFPRLRSRCLVQLLTGAAGLAVASCRVDGGGFRVLDARPHEGGAGDLGGAGFTPGAPADAGGTPGGTMIARDAGVVVVSDAGAGGSPVSPLPPVSPPPDSDAAVVVPGDRADASDAVSSGAPARPPAPPACPAASNDAQVDTFSQRSSANCSFEDYRPPPPLYAAAVDSSLYAGSGACGACIELSTARGKVVVQAVEHYPVTPEGGRNRISVTGPAMDLLAAAGDSVVQAKWRWVPCPVTGPIRAALKSGSSQFYWEVILLNFTTRLSKLEFRSGSGTWKEVKRESYNYFRQPDASALPEQLRLTDAAGNQTVSRTNLRWDGTTFIPLDTQFPPACVPGP